jgi:ubiquinone/menaquinone biosynthesis C-methylase UbiE
MSSPHHPLLARVYDTVMMPGERSGLRDQRVRLCEPAAGHVVEIGVGTGLNLLHYERAERVVGVDADRAMLHKAHRRRQEAKVPVRLVEADARQLPFAARTFDTVVIGLALCTIVDPRAALDELLRVTRPNAELHFLEHVRSSRPFVGRLEDRFAPLWGRIAGGCRPNQDTLSFIESSGWRVVSLWRSRHGGLIQGTAISAVPETA